MPTARKIVLIMTDTQGVNVIGCYGAAAKGLKTPCIDRLASQGLRFDRAYCCQPVCGPARSALFTGVYPHSNASIGNSMPLADTVRTMGQRFAAAGFSTAYIGKWHLDGHDYFGTGTCPPGWDDAYWYDMRCYLDELSPEERQRSRQPSTCLESGFPATSTYGHRCTQRAIGFLESHQQDDFLLVVSYDEPHHPFLCPSPYNHAYDNYLLPYTASANEDLSRKPEHQRLWSASAWKGQMKPGGFHFPLYFGCNEYVDNEIGRVLAAVERLAPDALVIFTSDHGDFLGAHNLAGKGPAAYDDIARIPFIVRWPGVAPAGAVSQAPASHIDILPTMLAAAGLPAAPSLEGCSMVASLADPSHRSREAAFIEFHRYEVGHEAFGGFQPMRAACDGRWKLAINLLSDDEFYDLVSDPDELVNLIDSPTHKADRERLHDAILAWMEETRDPFRGYYWRRRPWRPLNKPVSWQGDGLSRIRVDENMPEELSYDTGLKPISPVWKR